MARQASQGSTGLFPAPPLKEGVVVEAGGRYLDARGLEWRGTATELQFSDGPYRVCVSDTGDRRGDGTALMAAANFRITDGAPAGHPTAARLVKRL